MLEPTSEKLSPFHLSVQDVIDHMLESVVITDENANIVSINPAFTKATGYTKHDLIGISPRILKSGKHKDSFYKKMWSTIERTGYWAGEIQNKKKNGEIYLEWLTISAIKDENGRITNYLGVFTDITKKKKAEETIRHMAYYDPLTGLPNRTLFKDRLKVAIGNAIREDRKVAVLFLDLDRVKLINDTMGHGVGDMLLIGVAERIQACLSDEDTVARLGGDEFMIFLPEVHDAQYVFQVSQQILSAIKPPFYIEGQEIYTTASVGISFFPDHGIDVDTLSKNADTAMYRAKRSGRNNFQLFTSDMKDEMYEELAFGNHMRRALEQNEFVVHYQPQINFATREIVGVEALIRWNHPKLGLVYPSKFIHWAEDSGLIVPLGEWVLHEACMQAKAWHNLGYKNLTVAVNLSARQFEEINLVKSVFRVLEDTNLPPSALDLELTESLLIEKAELMQTIPFELQKVGVKFSIDDFGAGYSSLSYLKKFPAHTLKMDQSFVKEVTVSRHDAAIASAVVALGHSLDLTVLAEGVETDAQYEFFKTLNCDKMQGYLVSKPLPATELEELMKKQKYFYEDPLFTQS